MMKTNIIKKGINLFSRSFNLLTTRILALSFRRKMMIATLLIVGASFYSAPFGMIILATCLVYEWKKSTEPTPSLWYLAKKSVFLIPGIIMISSAVIGPMYFGHFFNAGLALLLLAPILFCAFAIEVLWQKEDALHFARYATMLIIPISIIAFVFPWSGGINFKMIDSLRVAATFSNPNYFSYILEIVLIFSIALYYHVWKPSSRIWLVVSFLLSMLCLYFTGSRTGMLAFLAGVTVYYLCMSEKAILVIVFGSITIILVATALFPEWSVAIFRDLIPRPETFLSEINNRFMLWDVALKQISKNPIMGTGLDTYRLLVPKDAPEVIKTSMHCHNIFINLWLETGLFGILSFVWIIIRAGIKAILELKNSTVRPYLSAGIGMIVITIIHGIMDAPLISAQTLSLFGLFLACLVVMNRKTSKI